MSLIARLEQQFQRHVGSGVHHLILCQPHPGVTFLAEAVQRIAGLPRLEYVQRSESNYAFDVQTAASVADRDGVIYLHAVATPALIAWIRAKGLRPVILFRDVAASIGAVHAHRLRQGYPVDAAICAAPPPQGLIYAAYEWGHWILRFQTKWRAALGSIDGLLLDHSEFAADLEITVGRVLEHLGIVAGQPQTAEALAGLADDHELAAIRAGGPWPGTDLPAEVIDHIAILRGLVR